MLSRVKIARGGKEFFLANATTDFTFASATAFRINVHIYCELLHNINNSPLFSTYLFEIPAALRLKRNTRTYVFICLVRQNVHRYVNKLSDILKLLLLSLKVRRRRNEKKSRKETNRSRPRGMCTKRKLEIG